MTSNQSNNSIKKNGIVIVLDALGVKNLGTKRSCEFIKIRDVFLEEVRYIRDKRAKEFKHELNIILPDPDIALFQDSIIICWAEPEIKQDTDRCHFSFFQAAGQWLNDAITEGILLGLYFRGAISQGEYIVNISDHNVTIIGPAIDDAMNFFEITDFVGVVQTQNCKNTYLSYLASLSKKDTIRLGHPISVEDVIHHYRFLFVKYSVPLSKSKINFFSTKPDSLALRKECFVSSWPVIACMIESKIPISKILFEKSITEKPEHQSKYFNSYQFLEWYKSQFWEGLKKRPEE
jgi:hypothetical protein